MKLLPFLILVCIFVQPASASLADLDLSRVLPDLIASGGNKFMESVGDQMYASIGVNNSTQAQEAISNQFLPKDDMITSKILQDNKDFNAFWFAVFYFLFAAFGLMKLMKDKAMPSKGFKARQGFGSQYLTILFGGIIMFMFYLYGINFIMDFEAVVARGILVQTVNTIPFTPANGITYFLSAMFSMLIGLFMQLRYILLTIVMTEFLLLVCLARVPVVGLPIKVLLVYAVTLLFFRILLAGTFLIGIGAIESLHVGGFVLPVIALLLIMVGMCFTYMVMPIIYVIMTIKKVF